MLRSQAIASAPMTPRGEAAGHHVGDGGGERVVAVEVEQLDGAGHAQAEALVR
ncbi:MAG: hypothetical protein HS111_22735 [Kofleriaceae bacterium]|nr:hypothetical protein [Kofleriaceae bacterium]